MTRLKQLKIAGFRGATKPFSLPFDANARFTIVYGENASGKSTICDAFELLSRGKVGSLDNRGLGTTTRYWPSLGRPFADISVILESEDGACAATVSRTGEVAVVPMEARPRVEVFRRTHIRSLVEAKPGDRYAAISRFIDVSAVENSEAALRELIRDLSKQREGAGARLDENELTIRQFWEAEGWPAPDPFTWAEAISAPDTEHLEAETGTIRSLQMAYARLLDLPGTLRSAQQALVAAKAAAGRAAASVEDRVRGISQDAGEVVGILEAANAYLIRHPSPAVCPLCESPGKGVDLGNRIRERLNALASLQEAQSQLATSTQAVQRAEQQFQLVRDNAREDVAKFEAARADRAMPAGIPLPDSPVPSRASALMAWLTATASLPAQWKKAEADRYGKKQFAGTLKHALDTWRVNGAALEDLDRLIPSLERALKIVEQERRRFTDDILASIAGEVSRLYDLVHPGERLNRISLELDPKKRASLEIGADFCEQPSRPQGYFSESHLDTLGLCIFLALAALDQPENTILVLDDVLSSVDDLHTQRLLNLLYAESPRFRHCILTTHSHLRKEPPEIQFIELAPWSAATGLSLR